MAKASPKIKKQNPKKAGTVHVGVGVSLSGQLHFDKSVRVDGTFDGTLVSRGGDICVSKTGLLVGDVNDMGTINIAGKVKGNLSCDVVIVGDGGTLFGDVTCKSITVSPRGTVVGRLNVHKDSPTELVLTDEGEIELWEGVHSSNALATPTLESKSKRGAAEIEVRRGYQSE